jgi:4-hydroxybutyryl-CoA dehydratase/vinylacetyl-CoA-Delta-isomerase
MWSKSVFLASTTAIRRFIATSSPAATPSLWKKGDPIRSSADYIQSLRNRGLTVYLFGDRVAEPTDHPMIRPSINAVAATYDLAQANPDLGCAKSSVSGQLVNRFLHVAESTADVVNQNRMQRKLGQMTGAPLHIFILVL